MAIGYNIAFYLWVIALFYLIVLLNMPMWQNKVEKNETL